MPQSYPKMQKKANEKWRLSNGLQLSDSFPHQQNKSDADDQPRERESVYLGNDVRRLSKMCVYVHVCLCACAVGTHVATLLSLST